MCGWEVERKERFKKSVLHHFAHALRVSRRDAHFLHELVACCEQRWQKTTFHAPAIFRLNAECSINAILAL
jgi:hypothetical protein